MIHQYEEDLKEIAQLNLPWEQLQNKTVLITGASGLIGGTLADALLYRNQLENMGLNLILNGRNEQRLRSRFSQYKDSKNLFFVCQDVQQPFSSLKKVDYIIHAASKGDPASFVKDPVGVLNANYVGTLNLLNLARECNSQKLVLISSGETYGILDKNSIKEKGISEEDGGYIDVSNPRNCYAIGKKAAESLCVSFSAQYGVDTSIVRLCHTYGGKILEGESRVIFQFMKNAMNGEDIVLKSSGEQRRSYCYIVDGISGILHVLLKGEKAVSYNVANPNSVVTLSQLAQIIGAAQGQKVVFSHGEETVKKGDSGIQMAVFDTKRIEELGFCGTIGIEEGVRRTLSIMKS